MIRTAVIAIETNLVTNIIEFDDAIPDEFLPGQLWIESNIAEIGDSWDGLNIIPKPLPAQDPNTVLKNSINQMNFFFSVALNSGITITDIPYTGVTLFIETDNNSRLLIHSAYTAASNGLFTTTVWQTLTGFTILTAAQVISIGQTVMLFEQSCFTKLQQGINALDNAFQSSNVPEEQCAAIISATVWPS